MVSGGLEDATGALYQDQDEIVAQAKMTPSAAQQRLIDARQRLMQRREPNPRLRNLAMAQGFLAPTRTGTFGEQLGKVAGALGDYEAGEQKRLTDIDRELLDTELALERMQMGQQTRDRSRYFQPRLYRDEYTGKMYEAIQGVDAQGELQTQWTGEEPPTEADLQPVSSQDPELQGQIAGARGYATGTAKRDNALIDGALSASSLIPQMQDALTLLDTVDREGYGTGGWQSFLQRMSNLAGIDTKGVADMGELNNLLGQRVLAGFEHFKGSLSDGERRFMVDLETSLGSATGVNRRIVERGLKMLQRKRQRGIDVARRRGDDDALALLKAPAADDADQPPRDAAPTEEVEDVEEIDITTLSDEELERLIREQGG